MTRQKLIYLSLGVFGLLAVSGLAAYLVFYDAIYEAAIRPKKPFIGQTYPQAPDYGEAQAWAALPARRDGADFLPKGYQEDNEAEALPVDVFFVHPTTTDQSKRWNASISEKDAKAVDRLVLPNLASAFTSAGRLYAPRYRQATYYTFRTRSDDSRLARRFAYQDVARAFRHYIDTWNEGRPFILAGAGQGAFHLVGLLQKEILGTELEARFIALYAAGAAVPLDLFDGTLAAVKPCTGPRQTACIAAWGTFPWETDASKLSDRALVWENDLLSPVVERPLLCVNPLTWRTDQVPAMADVNPGSLPLGPVKNGGLPALVEEAAGAHCVDGILRVDRPRKPALRRTLYPGRPYHELDIPLFYESIRRNVRERAAAYLEAAAKE